jgi:hypothetical protein
MNASQWYGSKVFSNRQDQREALNEIALTRQSDSVKLTLRNNGAFAAGSAFFAFKGFFFDAFVAVGATAMELMMVVDMMMMRLCEL